MDAEKRWESSSRPSAIYLLDIIINQRILSVMENKLSRSKEAVLLAYQKGYRVIDGRVLSPRGIWRKLQKDRKGYWTLGMRLSNPRSQIPIGVNVMVAYQKFGDKILEDGIVVRHLDGNSQNNLDYNIAIGTQSENVMDNKPEVRMKVAINAASKKRIFTDAEMNLIREENKNGANYPTLMKKYDISSKGTLWHILNNKYVTKI
jgi:hypothetical protein